MSRDDAFQQIREHIAATSRVPEHHMVVRTVPSILASSDAFGRLEKAARRVEEALATLLTPEALEELRELELEAERRILGLPDGGA